MINLLFSLLISLNSNAFVKVALLDTGVDPKAPVKFCPSGHYDFNEMKEFIAFDPKNDHGTIMAKIIDQESDKDYCIISYRVMPTKDSWNLSAQTAALSMALINGAKVINMSYTQPSYDEILLTVIKKLTDYGIFVNVAAGNEGKDFDKKCDLYPACYKVDSPFFNVYGGLDITNLNKDLSYNHGKIIREYLPSCFVDNMYLRCGTSMSTAVATGITIKAINRKNKQ